MRKTKWLLRMLLKQWLPCHRVSFCTYSIRTSDNLQRMHLFFLRMAGPLQASPRVGILCWCEDTSVGLTRSGQLAFSRITASESFWSRSGTPMHSYNLELGGSFSLWGGPWGGFSDFRCHCEITHCMVFTLPGEGRICAEEAHLSRLWADSERRAAGTLVQQPKEVVASQCHRILRCHCGTAVTMDCFTLPYASSLFHLGIICTLRKSGRRQSTICPCHLGCVCLCWASAPLACCFVVSRLGDTLLAGGSVTRLSWLVLFVVVSLLFP